MVNVIATERLDLVLMTQEFLECTYLYDHAEAEAILGMKIPPVWFESVSMAGSHLRQLAAGRTSQPWLPRAIGFRNRGEMEMVGDIGFHTPPGPDYLKEISPQGVEFGYTIFPDFRRRGIASEATRGLISWAFAEYGVNSFVAMVSPENTASLGVLSKLGFSRTGTHIDHENSFYEIFELAVSSEGFGHG
jgi:ribosomal-protein-alanine N-acetyltransferase